MTATRSLLAACALLSLLGMPSRAQQWGGSPPATSSRNPSYGRSTHVARQIRVASPYNSLVGPNAFSFVFGSGQGQPAAAASGGSWNGSWTQWGGGAPAQASQQVGTSAAAGRGTPNQRHAPIAAADSPAPADDMTSANSPATAPAPTPPRVQSRQQLTRAEQYLRERRKP